VELVYFEKIENRSEATKREIEIKKLTKQNKLKLINNNI
jgi:predicted GIY-YIG superfamily endonuclease